MSSDFAAIRECLEDCLCLDDDALAAALSALDALKAELADLREQLAEYEDEQECCLIARATGESHYHCANCGDVSSMMGHRSVHGWTCIASGLSAGAGGET